MRSLGASRIVCCGWAITWPTTRRTWTTREISKRSARRSFLSPSGPRGENGGHPGLGKGGEAGWWREGGKERKQRGGYALGLDCSLQGPSKLTATGPRGRAGHWGTAKSGGNFYNGFLYILFFASVNLRWLFFFFFSGLFSWVFWLLVCFWFFFPPFLLSFSSYSFPSPDLRWGADISCTGIVIPFLIAAYGTQLTHGLWARPAGGGGPAHPGRAQSVLGGGSSQNKT